MPARMPRRAAPASKTATSTSRRRTKFPSRRGRACKIRCDSYRSASREDPAVHGHVVERSLDVGEKLVLAQRVPPAIVRIDRAGVERLENLADAVLDGPARPKIEQLAHAI